MGIGCKVPKSYLSKRYATCRQVRTQVNWREIYREHVMLQMHTFLFGRILPKYYMYIVQLKIKTISYR